MLKQLLAVTLCALCALPGAGRAEDWPAKSITLIVPFAAGGGIDSNARVQALGLGEVLGQTIIVENIGAAGGTVGTARAARAAPDGYTLLIGNSGTHAYAPTLYKSLSFDPIKDFEPVGITTESPRILVVRTDLPVKNLQDFITYTKANYPTMLYASAGVGSATHLPCALLNTVLGVDVRHVPYRGSGPAMQDLVGGRVDYMCDTIQTGGEQAKAGTVKAARDRHEDEYRTEPHGRAAAHPEAVGGVRSRDPAAGSTHARVYGRVPAQGHRALGQGHPRCWPGGYRRQLMRGCGLTPSNVSLPRTLLK